MNLPAGKKEIIFALSILCSSLFLVNSMLFGGLYLGFAIGFCLCILCSSIYLICAGNKPDFYTTALLVSSLIAGASFARSDDGTVKFVLLMLLIVTANLALCLLSGKNHRRPESAASLLDSVQAFSRGFSGISDACAGIGDTCRSGGAFVKKGGAVLLGIGISLPLLLILVPLLMTADAAFEGLMDQLPAFSFSDVLLTLIFGSGFALVTYTQGVSLQHRDPQPKAPTLPKGLSSITVNTILTAVCVVYSAYLASQLAYFAGGFSGILPAEYTLAEYARRGFFEMAWLCALNLSIIVGALWVCKQKDPTPRFTRILCLFLGIMTLFLVSTASAKMLLYINSYGLTRLRVLTQVVMVFFGIVTVLVCLWLFLPKLPYMKCVMLTALLLAALVSWADVDTVVARYNTHSYLSGKMETVDTRYLNDLGDGAVPYLVQLHREAPDAHVRDAAYRALTHRQESATDLRSWNYASHIARAYLEDYTPAEPDILPNTDRET